MKEVLNIETERIDDIPLLLTHMQHMHLATLLDKHFPVQGLRKGLSVGELSMVWLTHLLSQADHRMNRVQEWGSRRLLTIALRVLIVLEGVVHQHIDQQPQALTGLFAGNPQRPTAERLLETLHEITLTIVSTPGKTFRHVTPLSSLQQQIVALCGFSPVIYLRLADDSCFRSVIGASVSQGCFFQTKDHR